MESQPLILVCATLFEAKVLLKSLLQMRCRPMKKQPAYWYVCDRDEDPRIVVVVTGIGPRYAQRGLKAALNDYRAETVVGFGFAGGLHEGIRAGDLVIARSVRSEEVSLKPSPTLDEALRKGVGVTALDSLWTAKASVNSFKEKSDLGKASGADAVDMESVAWGSVCSDRGISWAVVRSVLDEVGDSIPQWLVRGVDSYGNLNWPFALGQLLSCRRGSLSAIRLFARAASRKSHSFVGVLVPWLDEMGLTGKGEIKA